jgi:hypothetical protein
MAGQRRVLGARKFKPALEAGQSRRQNTDTSNIQGQGFVH